MPIYKLNRKHVKWLEFIEKFSYVIWYKKGKENRAVDVLSKRYDLLNTLHTRLFGSEHIKTLYSQDAYFAPIVKKSHAKMCCV